MMKSVLVTIHTDGSNWNPRYVHSLFEPPVTYVKGQLERGAEGKEHWQLYAEAKPAQGLQKWKELLMAPSAHIEGRRGTQQDCINYVSKEDTRLHGPETDFETGTPGIDKGSADDAYKAALEAETFDVALKILKARCPRDFVLYHKNIISTLQHVFEPKWNNMAPELIFTIPKISNDLLIRYSIVIMGTTGLGKTMYALSHFNNPIMISHIDDLKKISPMNDGIVFDDMCFGHWPPNSCIHITDMEHPRSINVKYGTITIPGGLRRIFTTNRPINELFSEKCSLLELQAITRRCHQLHIHQKLF